MPTEGFFLIYLKQTVYTFCRPKNMSVLILSECKPGTEVKYPDCSHKTYSRTVSTILTHNEEQ